ncbi:PrsW family intramembrane metalloprotease [Schaalia sp. 19OD2882]|uniref:PrsW family intramembrane metalloprotease n=1 Tax=Schaalia sp. 19OD2882 TaxID=2794089 RepID=UPI0020A82037|nr:PrsW family intramembrane metalloprotease [Schaalia sp. 19OD2882]
MQQAPPARTAPSYAVPRSRSRIAAFEIVVLIVSTIGFLLMVGLIFVSGGGLFGTPIMAILALPSLLIVMATFHFIDRWEIEPLWTRLASLAWGAGVATVGALIVNQIGGFITLVTTGDQALTSVITASVVAPLSEESLKGLVVLILVLVRRHQFQSYLDGVLHAGLVAAGFAFTENILYFVNSAGQGGVEGVAVTVFLRGVMSPFLHPMATSMIGLALGWAVTRMPSRHAWVWMAPIGWFAAVSIHGLWNLLASVLPDIGVWFIVYAVVQVPLFAVWMTALIMASNREAKHIAVGLGPYVASGWMLPAEVAMATNGAQRRGALRWARTGGPAARKAMASFLNIACGLGLDQVVMSRLGPDAKRIESNQAALVELCLARQTYLRATGTRIDANGTVFR